MKARVMSSRKGAVKVEEKVSDSAGHKYSAWRGSGLFCAMRHINDPRYLEGDMERSESGGVEARKENMQIRASRIVSRGECRKQKLLQVAALRNITNCGRALRASRRGVHVLGSKQHKFLLTRVE